MFCGGFCVYIFAAAPSAPSAAPFSFSFFPFYNQRNGMKKAWRREGRYGHLLFSRFFSSEQAISSSSPSSTAPSSSSSFASSFSSSKWIVLPAVPPAKGIARLLGQTELSALKWLSRCCPEISHNNVEKLFRTRKVFFSSFFQFISLPASISRKYADLFSIASSYFVPSLQ